MLTPELQADVERIRGMALAEGLDPFPVDFQLVDSRTLNGVAALGGFPARFPHWKFGMEFTRLDEMHRHGMMHIYECIINTLPSVAYLRTTNTRAQNRLVIAHCYAHSDFFKNNAYFAHTDRAMLGEMELHRDKVMRHENKHGVENVERFLDACMSIENLIDPHLPAIRRDIRVSDPREKESAEPVEVGRLPSKEYMDPFINPDDLLRKTREELEKERAKMLDRFPQEPTRDILGFLLHWAKLEPWQRDILAIVRNEAYYFLPQRQTKIINEGWASYWHAKLMAEGAADDADLIEYADVHAGVVAQHQAQMNPYRMGLYLLRDIKDRWDKGKFGKDWETCDDRVLRERWDRQTMQGKSKLLEVRRVCSDVRFIDDYLTPEMVMELKLFTWDKDEKEKAYYISSRDYDAVKGRILQQLTNCGEPVIYLENADYSRSGALQIRHEFTGPPLKQREAEDTVRNLHTLWGRPVLLDTVREGRAIRLVYRGGEKVETENRTPTPDEERLIDQMRTK